MRKKTLKVDREKFEGIVQNLLNTKPVKREDMKVNKRKPEKLIPPQKSPRTGPGAGAQPGHLLRGQRFQERGL
jgi:hypothetical protein